MRRSLLILIVLLAFWLRVHQLDNYGFWQDEGLTPLRSGYSLSEILSNRVIIQNVATNDTHPPFYFLVAKLNRALLGESDFSYRYPAVLAGVLLVPLLYQFGRRLGGYNVGFLAALLAAVNPLYIWYSQEARMYTLVVLLAAVATYALWRAFSGQHLLRWLIIYIIFAGLAFLTHYTAAILIAVQAPFWIWLLWQKGHRRFIIGGIVVGLLVLIPFIPFTVPRLFTGAEANYFYVSPLVMLQDVVHGFGMGSTVSFSDPIIRVLDVAVAVVLIVGFIGPQWRKEGRLPRTFLLVYLLAIVVGLALGSLLKPMYQGIRHTMIGSVAFILLLARGILAVPQRYRPLSYMALILVLLGPAISLNNLYNNPRYAKDDIRALVQYIEERAGDRDIVVYNNAILLTMHEHYRQRSDLPFTALPVYPHGASEQTEVRLQELADQYERIWFVTDPPADGRDAAGLVKNWLEENLLRIDEQTTHARTMLVKVVAYDTRPWIVQSLPSDSQNSNLTWPETPDSIGWQENFNQPAELPTLWIDLYWAGGSPPSSDKQLRFSLQSEDGQSWLDVNQPFWEKNVDSYFDASMVRLSYGLPIPVGTPPGTYDLMLLPWDKATGNPSGDWASLGTVTLGGSDSWPMSPELTLDTAYTIKFENGVWLLGLNGTGDEVRPGHAIPLTMYWQAPSYISNLRYELEVTGPDGAVWQAHSSEPGPEWLEAESWPADSPVREQIGLLIPADAPSGKYRLRWRLLEEEEVVGGRPSWRPWTSDWITYGEINVRPWPLVTELPAADNLIESQFGTTIQLYGYDAADRDPQPGRPLDLTLYWQALADPESNYYTFVHLVSREEGDIVSQIDRIPVDWLRPTKGWREGEVLYDHYDFPIPADLSSGLYDLYVGLYDPETFERLPVAHQGLPQADNQLLLTTLTIS